MLTVPHSIQRLRVRPVTGSSIVPIARLQSSRQILLPTPTWFQAISVIMGGSLRGPIVTSRMRAGGVPVINPFSNRLVQPLYPPKYGIPGISLAEPTIARSVGKSWLATSRGPWQSVWTTWKPMSRYISIWFRPGWSWRNRRLNCRQRPIWFEWVPRRLWSL